jgi:predicted PurR-regulated permease PerM
MRENLNYLLSFKAILSAAFVLVLGFIIYTSYEVLITVALAVVVALSIEPLIKWFEHIKIFGKHIINRAFSVLFSYVLVLAIIVGIFVYVIPDLVDQVPTILETSRKTIETYSKEYNLNFEIPDLTNYTGQAVTISLSFFSNIISILSLILLSLYISLELKEIKLFFHKLLSDGHKSVYDKIISELELGMGHWVRGQLILMLVIGLLSTVVLYFIGNPYYLPLGILAGLFEVVPVVGPILTAILAASISYSTGGVSSGLITLVAFYIIQLIENNFLVPKVMQKVSGFSPVLILLAFLVFSNLLGVVGAIIAIPILIFLNILIKNLVLKREEY